MKCEPEEGSRLPKIPVLQGGEDVNEDAIRRIRARGNPAGILSPDTAFTQRCIEVGTTSTAVAIDVGILARGAEKLAQQFRPAAAPPPAAESSAC